jgi:sporulation protein YabP
MHMDRAVKTPEKPYGMTVDQRRKAVITGVTDVESFDETAVVLHTHGGRLTLTGSGLHVSSLHLEEGRLTVDGTIDSAAYDGGGRRRGAFLRRALG